jgi:hypothetical protein
MYIIHGRKEANPMKKVARIVGLCSKPLQRRYLAATPGERQGLLEIVDQESDWILNKMRKKGYVLEGKVADIYGIFLRGQARGTIQLERDQASVS